MKRTLLLASAALAALLCQSCAKTTEIGLNDANKKFFDSWMKVNYPGIEKDGIGIYIIDDQTGTGRSIGSVEDYPYAYVTFTVRDLDGNITETTDIKTAQQVGTYDEGTYYGPKTIFRNPAYLSAGVEDMLGTMKIGGTRTAVIPGWLDTKKRYDSEEGYLKNETGENYIYTLTLHDSYPDIVKYQIDSIENYLVHNFKSPVDSTMYGYYYIQTQAPSDDTDFKASEKVYVNYTGRLLNGQIFDTSDEKTAKEARIYSSGKEYEPLSVEIKEDYKDMSTVQGFSYCVSKMKKGEKGICIFYSTLGYGSTDKSSIPSYSPLRFDIEMLGKEKK